MSYQACPICDGAGGRYKFLTWIPCSTCNGTKLIHTTTAKPPQGVVISGPPEIEIKLSNKKVYRK